MKYTFGLLFLLLANSISLRAQDSLKIDLVYPNTGLELVVLDLEKRYPLNFSYNPEFLEGIVVNLDKLQIPLEQALHELLDPWNIGFRISDLRHISLIPPSNNQSLFRKICGTIFDAESGESVPGATVAFLNALRGISSDKEGYFELIVTRDSNEELIVSYLGYEDQSIQLKDLNNGDCLEISLQPKINELGLVLVSEYLTEGISSGNKQHEQVLDPGRMKTLPGLVEPDVLLMTQMLPGISSANESASGINIRGGTPDQNLILYDGIPIYSSGHFFGMISAFNPYIVDKVDVFRSGFDASYGGRVASVIDIRSKDEIKDQPTIGLGSNLTHGFVYGQIPVAKKKVGLIFSARRSITDLIESPTYNQLFNRVFQLTRIQEQIVAQDEQNIDALVDFYYYDVNAKLIIQPGSKNKISISGLWGANNLNYAYNDYFSDLFTLDFLNLSNSGLSVDWKREWNESLSHSTSLNWSAYDSRYNFKLQYDTSTVAVYDAAINNKIEDFTFRQVFNLELDASNRIDFGYQYEFKDLGYGVDYKSSIEEDFENEFLQSGGAHIFHGNYIYQNGSGFKSNFGIRASVAPWLNKVYLEPRFSLEFRESKQALWRISGGWYTQFISQLLEFNPLEVNNEIWVLADNEGIPVIRAVQLSGGGLFNFGDITLDAELYYKHLDGIISLSPNFRFSPNNPYDQGTSDILGFDLLLKKDWSHSKSWISYSYSDVTYRFTQINRGAPFPAFHEQPQRLQLAHQQNWKDLSISAGWQFASGLPYTSPTDVRLVEDASNPNTFELVYATRNDQRLNPFHRLDLSFLYKIHSRSYEKGSGRLGLSFLNLYNRKNEWSKSFYLEDDSGNIELVELDRSLLGFTPNLSFQWEF